MRKAQKTCESNVPPKGTTGSHTDALFSARRDQGLATETTRPSTEVAVVAGLPPQQRPRAGRLAVRHCRVSRVYN